MLTDVCTYPMADGGYRPMVMGIWWMNYSMAMGIQQMGIRLMMDVGIWCLCDNPDTKNAHSYWQKMTKMQQMRIRLMATGTQQMNVHRFEG